VTARRFPRLAARGEGPTQSGDFDWPTIARWIRKARGYYDTSHRERLPNCSSSTLRVPYPFMPGMAVPTLCGDGALLRAGIWPPTRPPAAQTAPSTGCRLDVKLRGRRSRTIITRNREGKLGACDRRHIVGQNRQPVELRAAFSRRDGAGCETLSVPKNAVLERARC